MTDPLSDEAFTEWFADQQLPPHLEPRDLVPYHHAKRAWKEAVRRAASLPDFGAKVYLAEDFKGRYDEPCLMIDVQARFLGDEWMGPRERLVAFLRSVVERSTAA